MAERARRRPLPVAEQRALAEAIRRLLDDPDARLSAETRHRWEGALVALEAVLGEPPSLAPGLDLDRLL